MSDNVVIIVCLVFLALFVSMPSATMIFIFFPIVVSVYVVEYFYCRNKRKKQENTEPQPDEETTAVAS